MKNLKKFTLLFILFFTSSFASAATVSLSATKNSFDKNEEFLLSVFVNTDNESLNAFSGTLQYPADILSEKEIRDGDSIVNFWVDRPAVQTIKNGDSKGSISFSGIIPNGFSGQKGFLFSVVFRAEKSGSGSLSANNFQFLKNDGAGTAADVKISSFSFSVSSDTFTGKNISPVKDTDPPEGFIPVAASDPNIFGGKYFVSFATQDKGSGIDYYEVSEGNTNSFVRADSPYLLTRQTFDESIFVKAVDRAGNERVVEISAAHLSWWKKDLIIFAILMLLIALVMFRKKLWKKDI